MPIEQIRQKKPLVHCMTNYVVANFTANGLLAIGASPIMADEISEVEEMVAISSALLINIGTINTRTQEAMLLAGKKANELGTPVVLDPVGVGATSFRKQAVKDLLEQVRFNLIRCNAGELAAIAGVSWKSKGVDSGEGDMDIADVAKQVAKDWNCIVAVTGASDYITDGNKEFWITGGHERMTEVTGTGCLLSAICTAALSLDGEALLNLRDLLQAYKQISEQASSQAQLPGSFQTEVLNALHLFSKGDGK
ncbi:hydroxyethylthiazole kinase [Paenisporosarcina sp. HGH0030]|uniref:hydroxyethylthiazole kinase n=1 Tax=Paenisporosarcina sp. HGH0030 TaxID=1078085 RepID=UPI00034E2E1D|nr:hydroxyethylthiazole kinase [Paenisporosarcina sp. HGH0030]EPD50268.1 hydroxyethylthiazole kinase [Paenisporosarcina sp. HGH0030]